VKIREYAFFPEPSAPVSLGLLLCDSFVGHPEGLRGTLIVDAEWLRTGVKGRASAADPEVFAAQFAGLVEDTVLPAVGLLRVDTRRRPST
jgi:hypothetical protein